MRDLVERLAEARESFDELSDSAVERTITRAKKRGQRRRRVRIGISLSAVVIAVMSAGVAYRGRATTMELHDGSTVAFADTASEIRITEETTAAIEVTIGRGRGRFDVVENAKRKFRVRAGEVLIEVVGTRFEVDRRVGEVVVEVSRGKVRVVTARGERFLVKGERASFADTDEGSTRGVSSGAPAGAGELAPGSSVDTSRQAAGGAIDSSVDTSATPSDSRSAAADERDATKDSRRNSSRAAPWRAAAARGNYDAAYGALHSAGAEAVRDVPEELMLAADVARWSHHPAAAVPYLQRVVREHKNDPRSQLAAFTLGRVYLDELGRPREAANAFAQARGLDVDGPLAADALAREVEAWSRADENGKALSAAEEYLRRYPNGPHTATVRRFGRLE